MSWALAISILKYILTLSLGFAAGFCYFAFHIAKDARPMTLELVNRMVAMHEKEGLSSLLGGRRQMIDAMRHQIDAHGLVHKDDMLAWLAKMDAQFLEEQTRIGERVAIEARRQLNEEEAQAKGMQS